MIKKFIPLFFLILCLTSCAKINEIQVENPDTLTAAVLCAGGSASAENTYNALNTSTVATLTADLVDVSKPADLSGYDILYVDRSVKELQDFNVDMVQSRVSDGASVVLDNALYNLFDSDFIGAAEFVPVNGCPVNMDYPSSGRDIGKIQGLISNFCRMYKSFADFGFLSGEDYGVGVVPSTAQCIASLDGVGIYTVNQYGNGYVFFLNPLLPNTTYAYPATVSFGKLLNDSFAWYASMKKYGYSAELVLGSYASPVSSWECHYEDISQIENGTAEKFEEMCKPYGQIPSFTVSGYIQSVRAETAETALCVPSYADNRLVLQTSDTGMYSRISERYELPLVFYNDTYTDAEERIKKVSEITDDGGYIFAKENQLAKMVAAAYNTRVDAKWENNGLSLSAREKGVDMPLYNENYQKAVGVKVTLAEGVAADEFGVQANVHYKKDNSIYVSLDRGARISKTGEHNDINITSVNLPAKISTSKNNARIEFLDDGLMTVSVKGNAKTTSEGWEMTRQNGMTTFRKYGNADTLKIAR